MRSGAFVIGATSNADTLNLWIAVVALSARANRFMIFNTAFGVWTAVAWIATDVIHAGPVAGTIRV